ncbi:hypothetical protein FOZ60_009229 [Perkinsus olseni]|uniref:Uncharacterized protein n=1 Tax=Perkinsus olseni TaxID=32597 RepID=A0A7J6NHP8_PEROL|nr:hypothetical protein FOZ60_009229 [Perkinsus olseni]
MPTRSGAARRSSARLSAARSPVDYSHLERTIQQPQPEHLPPQLADSASCEGAMVPRGKRARRATGEVVPAPASSGTSGLVGIILKQSGVKKTRTQHLSGLSIDDLVQDLNEHEGVQLANDGITAAFLSKEAVTKRREELDALVGGLVDVELEEAVKCLGKLSQSSIRKIRIVVLEAAAGLVHSRAVEDVLESVVIPRVGDIAAVVREAAVAVLVNTLSVEALPETQREAARRALFECLQNDPESAVRAAGLTAMATVVEGSGVALFSEDTRDEWCSMLLDCCYDATVRVQTAAGRLLEVLFDNDEEMASEESPFMSEPLRLWWLLWDNSACPRLQDSIARIVSKHILADDVINNNSEEVRAWPSLKAFIETYSPFRGPEGTPDPERLGKNPTGRAVAPFVRLAPELINTASCWRWARPYLLGEDSAVDGEELTCVDRAVTLDILRTVAQTEIKEKGKTAVLPPFDLKALCEKYSDASETLASALAVAAARSRVDKIPAFRVCFRRLEQFHAVATSGG